MNCFKSEFRMGARVWKHIVPFEENIETVVRRLQQQVFGDGLFYSVDGPYHSIEDALESATESGTRSILDVYALGDEPDIGVMGPLSEDMLEDYFESRTPTREDVEANLNFLDELERGAAVYIILYKNGVPNELFFAGISFD